MNERKARYYLETKAGQSTIDPLASACYWALDEIADLKEDNTGLLDEIEHKRALFDKYQDKYGDIQ